MMSETLSKGIARTGTVYARNLGSLTEARLYASLRGRSAYVIWHTILDGKERPSHNARNGKIYTLEQAAGLLGEPNCRCGIEVLFW